MIFKKQAKLKFFNIGLITLLCLLICLLNCDLYSYNSWASDCDGSFEFERIGSNRFVNKLISMFGITFKIENNYLYIYNNEPSAFEITILRENFELKDVYDVLHTAVCSPNYETPIDSTIDYLLTPTKWDNPFNPHGNNKAVKTNLNIELQELPNKGIIALTRGTQNTKAANIVYLTVNFITTHTALISYTSRLKEFLSSIITSQGLINNIYQLLQDKQLTDIQKRDQIIKEVGNTIQNEIIKNFANYGLSAIEKDIIRESIGKTLQGAKVLAIAEKFLQNIVILSNIHSDDYYGPRTVGVYTFNVKRTIGNDQCSLFTKSLYVDIPANSVLYNKIYYLNSKGVAFLPINFSQIDEYEKFGPHEHVTYKEFMNVLKSVSKELTPKFKSLFEFECSFIYETLFDSNRTLSFVEAAFLIDRLLMKYVDKFYYNLDFLIDKNKKIKRKIMYFKKGYAITIKNNSSSYQVDYKQLQTSFNHTYISEIVPLYLNGNIIKKLTRAESIYFLYNLELLISKYIKNM